jgi:hypothetical protein
MLKCGKTDDTPRAGVSVPLFFLDFSILKMIIIRIIRSVYKQFLLITRWMNRLTIFNLIVFSCKEEQHGLWFDGKDSMGRSF